MSALQLIPGERVLLSGEYVLVSDFGEDTGAPPRKYNAGENLPFVTATSEFGELCFVRLPDSTRKPKERRK